MASGISWRRPVISSIQTRLLIAVGLLATAAVIAVGLSARQSARQEFERFQTVERVREQGAALASLERIAASLDGKCCAPGEVAAAAAGIDYRTLCLWIAKSGLARSSGRRGRRQGRRQCR